MDSPEHYTSRASSWYKNNSYLTQKYANTLVCGHHLPDNAKGRLIGILNETVDKRLSSWTEQWMKTLVLFYVRIENW